MRSFDAGWRRVMVLAAALVQLAAAQTAIDLKNQGKNVDFSAMSATKPMKSGAALPATCSQSELFFLTTATGGANVYGCTSQNTWTVIGGPGGLTNLAEDADGTDKAVRAFTWAGPFRPAFQSGGTTNCDLSRSNVCEIALGGATALALSNPHGSGSYLLRSCQDSTGSRAYSSFPGNAVGFVQPDPGSTVCTEQSFTYDGAIFRAGVASVPNSTWNGGTFGAGLFSVLPACGTSYEGSIAPVKDSTANTWGSTIAGGGANHVLAYCDGSNWTVAAK